MSELAKKIISSALLSIPSAVVGLIARQVLQTWGVLSPFSEWLGGWLKMHVSPTQAGRTIVGVITSAAYAALLWRVWRHHSIPQIADTPRRIAAIVPGNPIETSAKPLLRIVVESKPKTKVISLSQSMTIFSVCVENQSRSAFIKL